MTGSRGPLSKPAGRRQRRNAARPALEIHDGGQVAEADIPKPPDKLLRPTVDRWKTFWRSGLGDVVAGPDMPALERLHLLYDERERTYRQIRRRGRTTRGSQGQLVATPLLKYLDQCDKEIRALEDRFGLTPGARLRLGATLEWAKRKQTQEHGEMEGEEPFDDPR